MAIVKTGKRIKIVCGTCGSEEVMRDAWAEWDVDAQEWVLGSVFDQGYCSTCDGEASLEEEPVDEESSDAPDQA